MRLAAKSLGNTLFIAPVAISKIQPGGQSNSESRAECCLALTKSGSAHSPSPKNSYAFKSIFRTIKTKWKQHQKSAFRTRLTQSNIYSFSSNADELQHGKSSIRLDFRRQQIWVASPVNMSGTELSFSIGSQADPNTPGLRAFLAKTSGGQTEAFISSWRGLRHGY